MFGVPVRAPVEVLKLIPGGVALIVKLAIAPPEEMTVKPEAAVFTVLVSAIAESVNAGEASVEDAGAATGTAPVVIGEVILEGSEVPSTLTADMLNV